MADHHKRDPLAGLLARELKATLPASAGVCPEPGVLAAYFERSLSAGEMAGYETHFAACPRCQEQLAVLARLETAVAPQRAPESAGGFSWFLNWRWLAPALAAAGALALFVILRPQPPTGQVALDTRNRSTASQPAADANKAQVAEATNLNAAIEPAKKVPPAADARVVLDDRLKEKEKDAFNLRAAGDRASAGAGAGRMAASEPARGGRLSAATDGKASRAVSATDKLADKAEAAKLAERADRIEVTSLPAGAGEEQKVAALRPPPAAAPVAGQEQALQKKNEIGTVASTVTVETAAETEAKRKQQAEDRAALQRAPAQQPLETAQTKVDAGAGPDADMKQRLPVAPRAAAQSQSQARQAAAPGAQDQTATQQVGALGAGRATASADQAKEALRSETFREFGVRDETSFFFAQSPSRRAVWRVGPQGRIEHYREPKKILELQNSGVTADLLSGSAPSEKVCWVVGRAGTILLTTDAGKTWQRLGSPSDADVIAIVATDETRATITVAGGKRYVTTDAGRSWKSPH